jgi:hypothetical protein
VPLAAVDLVFLAFVLVQVTVLFGGRAHVLTTEGLSYAEYARSGFWQLLVTTALTLLVLATAARKAARVSARDRALVRALLGGLCALTLVVVASAVYRMWLYEQEFGFTRLRIFVTAVELWLGLIIGLLLIAGIRLRGRWLPRAVVAATVVAVLALAAYNPDAAIAAGNIDRYERTGRIDIAYLAGLSPDAVPVLDGLPAPLRDCALAPIAATLSEDSWFDFNVGRYRARAVIAAEPVGRCLTP